MPRDSNMAASLRAKVRAGDSNYKNKTLGFSKSTPTLSKTQAIYSSNNDSYRFRTDKGDEVEKSINNAPQGQELDEQNEVDMDADTEIIENFIDTLNMTDKQKSDLYIVPNMFYYLRIRVYPDLDTTLNRSQSDATVGMRRKGGLSHTTHTSSTQTLKSSPSRYNTILEPLLPTPQLKKTKRQLLYTAMTGSIYDLEMIDPNQINKDNYLTISSRGITLFHQKESSFTAMEQWNREFIIFQKMLNIRFFKLYRRWKSFVVWKRSLRRLKMQEASKKIESQLFVFNPSLQVALMKIRDSALTLSHHTVIHVEERSKEVTKSTNQNRKNSYSHLTLTTTTTTTTTATAGLNTSTNNLSAESTPSSQVVAWQLNDFENKQKDIRDILKMNMEKTRADIIMEVKTVCDYVVDTFVKSNNIDIGHKMTFIEKAALRAQCRRLTRFIRLIDLVMCNQLRDMFLTAINQLEQAVTFETSTYFSPRLSEDRKHDDENDDDVSSMVLKLSPRNSQGSTDNLKTEPIKLKSPLFSVMAQVKKVSIHATASGDNTHDNHPPHDTTATSTTTTTTTTTGSTATLGEVEAEECIVAEPEVSRFNDAIEVIIENALGVITSYESISNATELESFIQRDEEDIITTAMMNESDSVDKDNASTALSTTDTDTTVTINPTYLTTSIRTNKLYASSRTIIFQQITQAYEGIYDFLLQLEPYRHIYIQNMKDCQQIPSIHTAGELDKFHESITLYTQQMTYFQHMPSLTDVGMYLVDSQNMKSVMSPCPEECLKAIGQFLPILITKHLQALLDILDTINPILSGEPTTVEAYVIKKTTKDKSLTEIVHYKERQSYIRSLIQLMDDQKWIVSDDIKAFIRMLKDGLHALEGNLESAVTSEDTEVSHFTTQVQDECPKLYKKVEDIQLLIQVEFISNPSSNDEKVIKYLSEQELAYNKLKAQAERLQEYQNVLKMPIDEFEVFDAIGSDLGMKVRLWKDKFHWKQLQSTILSTKIQEIDTPILDRELNKLNKTAFLAEKALVNNPVVSEFKASVDTWNPVLPIITDLRNPALKERHWEKICKLIGASYDEIENFTLSDLISRGVTSYQNEISVISTAALQESILEEMMSKVTIIWEKLEFEVKSYKDIKDLYILGDTSDIAVNLDDSLVTINTVLGSRYVAGIRTMVDSWKSKLMHFQETLDEWLTCQRNWMYLETIFNSPDIVRQLPGPAKIFQAVNKSWRWIMKQTYEDPNALKAVGFGEKSRLEIFRSHNMNLDQIQKDLEDYLETKRMAFPRFYFLSNDELLEILSQAKDPKAVQPHLRKCFDNLVKLEFGNDENSSDILAMFSSENEKVGLGRNLKARGPVEEWLTAVEKRMKESLHLCMKTGLLDYDTRPRDEWVYHHPGQIVATVAQMTWARETEAALKSDNPIQNMLQWASQYKEELQKLIVIIRGTLTPLVRSIIVALVTTDVHARDIIDELCGRQVTSIHDFLWQQQLRYYWDMDVDNCIIRHSDARINYGYEYMGATSRLVITPLTDRCWLTLTGSYALKLGAAPAGPAGTGKTESSKDLAKAIGIQCVVFNCSDQIDYKMMGKLFRGLAQSGSWVCLDEFNRIDIEVLSVVAQQLLVLREGRQAKKNVINFMGITIPLVDHHVIITMNPGYAGRTELPDNLQVCFRPVSMMVPNYALIAEIMLFAEGFGDAKNLSCKMCKLYILCSEQLSQQPHYDYGLRAVKSVLVLAGGLKRANPNMAEELVLIRALRDSNVPKFLADDLPLFAAIVNDLFPGVDIPPNDYGELLVALEEEILKAGLQKVPKFIEKVIQMFDIFKIRFGATLVGPAATGKSTCYRILAALMTNLREKGSINPDFERVKYKILNPKSITMGELYGEFNPLTQEWRDGLASSIMREFVAEETKDKRWTVFDGPIDALWIENMNTVLDDNMTLCLANGQRIKLKQEMKCLFEVNDLAVASPATVSRIGVVYMTPSDLGWLPYVKSWLPRDLPHDCPQVMKDRIDYLFEHFFAYILQHQRKYGKEPVETVDIQLVISLCKLLQSLLRVENGVNFSHFSDELLQLIDKLFIFSLTWTVGASCVYTYWPVFSDIMKQSILEYCPTVTFPNEGSVFDYYVLIKGSPGGEFKEWSDTVPKFVYDTTTPYFSMVVPTVDTSRFSYIMEALIAVDKPCFLTGVTGTGKTVAINSLISGSRAIQPVMDGGLGLIPIMINFSAQTRSDVTQRYIESKLEKKRKNLLGAPAGRKCVIFIDDVNMPLVETYGAQPPIELIRQLLDFKGTYDREKLFWKDISDVLFFAAAAPPGGGRAPITQRFGRHFNVLCLPPASESSLTLIFESILSGFLHSFVPEIQALCLGTVQATIEVYQRISKELLPTPAKFHYLFNLRDISKVFQGMLSVNKRKCSTEETFIRLWVHETSRVFADRLINHEDQVWFQSLLSELCNHHLHMNYTKEDLFDKSIIFADFLRPDADPRYYEDVRDLTKLTAVLNDMLDNYNATFPTQMNLVFFTDALNHIARIARIIRQPRGNAMLIGVGGSGKQSLTRMAAFVCNMSCLSIEINRGYGINEFREDIKKFMMMTGVEGKDIVFLFTDSQIIDETMLEDLNNILNTGEVSNLFAQDETDKIVNDMISICKEASIPETRDNCLTYFTTRVRAKLHIVLAMSPVGDALRIRCRQFPSLINCSTIDWFHSWPESALVSVAERFLGDITLPSEEIRASVVKMCGFVHRSIENTAVQFFNELRRKIYTTPKSYLDLINLYLSMLKDLQDVVDTKSDRMKIGVRKLSETNAIVDALREELIKLEPVLKAKSIETEALLKQVAVDSADANIVAEKVALEEIEVSQQAAETSAVAEDAQKDLDRALPALESAVKALKSLTKADITEVKSFPKPPEAVRVVMEAVCTLLGEKESWDNAKAVLSKSDFMDRLTNYDKDNIPDNRLKKLRREYINHELMQPEKVKTVSAAGLGLCLWARAMDVYADVAKEVEPKKQRLNEMNRQLAITTAALKEKQDQLKAVQDKVAALQNLCDETLEEKNRLQEESDTTAQRLVRAEKLTSGLNSEGVRWKGNITSLAEEKINLIGDCFLSCACISYYGGFTGTYRDQLIATWLNEIRVLQIPASIVFSLSTTLGDPVRIRQWQNEGLPTDSVSINNGILVDKCRRWPLMIDPQQQANQWIRKMEEKNNLLITTMRDPNLLRALENCIRLGKPLLLEDLGESIEPALEPVLQKAVFKQGNRLLIRLGDSDVDYDPNFKLYMTTKLPNPHYMPEICIKVTIINFTVTMEGLEAQLLGDVVKAERPEIEEKKVTLLLQMSEDKKQLQQLESLILKMLSESTGNILDDENLINTLSESKTTSLAIAERVAEAEVTEKEINEARSRYVCIATRGSIIYFVIADLAMIDPMYQYSLSYYTTLFQRCIEDSEKSNELDIRLQNIIQYMTLNIYQNICRGLFEKDKLLFSASICFQILRYAHEIHDTEWNLYLRGPGVVDRTNQPENTHTERIPTPMWDLLHTADQRLQYTTTEIQSSYGDESVLQEGHRKPIHLHSYSHPFANICHNIATCPFTASDSLWTTWLNSDNLIISPLPPPYQDTVNPFQRLILIKALCEDKLQQSIANFVRLKLGKLFGESPAASMEDIYKDLNHYTPCIFVLSTGADPTGMLLRFAKKQEYADRLSIVSLGQGQGPYAKQLIENGIKTGDWVILQNCMLAKSWMPELESIVFDIQERAKSIDGGGINPSFRLYLTSAPAEYFPVSILQNGVKMTNEPPKGFRANLVRSFGNLIKADDYECRDMNDLKKRPWKKLLCGLAFFHANIQERRKFGPLGWNIRYAFDESDLETSIAVLKRFLMEQDEIPWDALNYVTGHINYGGRVTDDWDRRCLISILSIYMTPSILTEEYRFSVSGTYYSPPVAGLDQVISYFDSLPISDAPEVFGMHENANVTFNTNESLNLMSALLSLQPKSSGSGADGKSSDEIVTELAASIRDICPIFLNEDEQGETTFQLQANGLRSSLAICLSQEMVKFNRLLSVMVKSLEDIKKAICGALEMSSDLDAMYTALVNNRLPSIWERVSFASLKSLSSWVQDLVSRVAFMRRWLVEGQPAAFPLPAFFFPQGFMTASLQTYARKHKEAIDGLSFTFSLLTEPGEKITVGPEDGVYVYGLYLEGARLDSETMLVCDSKPGQMYDILPAIHFQPVVAHRQQKQTYLCPVYKTAVRKGVLSTTGMSTNYVVAIELPMREGDTEQKWILGGVAALCNLTD